MGGKENISFFWLHLKKCGGTSIKNYLGDIYCDIPNQSNLPSFVQIEKKYWNSILNNSRCNLGDYLNKRSYFAKTFLYTEEWDNIYGFTFVRNPLSRCVSMFHYINYASNLDYLKNIIRLFIKQKKIIITKSNYFDWFLELLYIIHVNQEKQTLEYRYKTNHFVMHTNPYFNDISDLNGNLLIKNIYKIENFNLDIKKVLSRLGIEPDYLELIKQIEVKILEAKKINDSNKINVLNKRKFDIEKLKLNTNNKNKIIPNSKQIKKIEEIYFEDFNIYNNI